jgi:hypothetical protein
LLYCIYREFFKFLFFIFMISIYIFF